jgi:DNA-directed RNA polymerase subunit omega
MIHKEINSLLAKVDCRYTLVVETAKRARQLIDGASPMTEGIEQNSVSQAVAEIETDKITYIRNAESYK